MAEILINNMKLPKNLYGAHIIIKPNGDVQDYLNGAIFAKAIELQPRGDLIDRSSLLKAFEKKIMEGSITVMDIFRIIDDEPTAVEASR